MDSIRILKDLEDLQFSGQLVLTRPMSQPWSFYLSQGRIFYATGGEHLVRRWRRHLVRHCPRLPRHRIAWQHDLGRTDTTALKIGWDYALLCLWVIQQKISQEQVTQMIGGMVAEVLFDVMQAVDVTHQVVTQDWLYPPLASFGVGDAIVQAQESIHTWKDAELTDYLPNTAPVIQHPERLQTSISADSYQNLTQLLRGEYTLRDLALQMQRDVVAVTISLHPFLQKQWIDLIQVPDLSAPIYCQSDCSRTLPVSKEAVLPGALIACIDDSFSVRYMLEKLLTSAGYQFLGIEDSMGAVGTLLARKPDLIFLDLVMPKANGYEICEQLRKLSMFRTTPIVILTGNDSFANRFKSTMLGASDFLSKPLDADTVLGVLHKHLSHQSNSLRVTS